MSKRKTQYPMGSVSSATMRVEDLVPCFVNELEYRRRNHTLQRAHMRELTAIGKRMDSDGYYDDGDADNDLEWLFTTMDAYSAPYFYFGAHPGDGADYGYWLSESWDQDAVSVDEIAEGCEAQGDMLLKVGDLSEVPAGYRGEIALVNDHGNVTLYVKSARKLTEIWGVV
jgi:hypothetical protein